MTKQELIEKLNSLQESGDIEATHGEADDLLIEFIGDKEIEEAFEKLEKWYA